MPQRPAPVAGGSRIVIEQAKGVIAGRTGMGVTEAFQLMRRYARGRGKKLRRVAQGVVDGEIELGTPWPSASEK